MTDSSSELIGRDLEIRAVRGEIAPGRVVRLVGAPGSGRSSVAAAAAEPLMPASDRVPLRARSIPLGAAFRWLEVLAGRSVGPLDPSLAFTKAGAAGAATALASALKKLGTRPLVIADIDAADPLSVRALEGALESLAGSAPPLVLTMEEEDAFAWGERIGIGPLPALACHDLLQASGVTRSDSLWMAGACAGLPLFLRLSGELGESRDRDEILRAAIRRMPAKERASAAMSAWGHGAAGTHPLLARTALDGLDVMERSRLHVAMARQCRGAGRSLHLGCARDPQAFRGLTELGEALMRRGHHAAACEVLDVAYGLRPADPGAAVRFAHAQLGAGRWSDAEYLLRGVLQERLKPELESSACTILASLRRRQGDLEEARVEIERAHAVTPKSGRVRNERAVIAAETGDLEAARADFAAVSKLTRDPVDRVVAVGNLAFLEARAGRHAAARKAFDTAVREAGRLGQDEDLAIALLNRSFLALSTRRFADAVKDAKRSARLAQLSGLSETEMRACGNLAEALLAMGEDNAAREAADRAIVLFGRLRGGADAAVWAFLVKAQALARMGEKRRASDARAAAKDLARAASIAGVYDEAVRALGKK